MSTSSPTRSTSSTDRRVPATVVIAIGSNLGDRRYNIRRAVHELGRFVRLVRVSPVRETEPVNAPAGSPPFLNAAVVGWSALTAEELMRGLLRIEKELGRVRRGRVNEPRVIDLDLIVYGGHRLARQDLGIPHPRAALRSFVMEPMRELGLTGAIAFVKR